MKITFVGFDIKFVLQETLQDQAYMWVMLCWNLGEDQNVINVHKPVDHNPDDIIDEGLENSRSIC